MFIQSLGLGLQTFFESEALALSILLVILNGLYLFLLRKITAAKASEGAAAPGCLTQILGILFQGFSMGFYVLLLLPLLLGISREIGLSSVESFILLASRAGILISLAVNLLAFIPFLGSQLAGSPGLEAFLVGAGIIRLTAPLLVEKSALGILGKRLLFPNLWESLGFILLAYLFSKTLMILVGLLRLPLQSGGKPASLASLIGPSLAILGGLLAMFMYAAFLRLAMGN